jgi:hypothetical protein
MFTISIAAFLLGIDSVLGDILKDLKIFLLDLEKL